MGKSRKKKNQFKDFQKVKLKVGKSLPKGLNETVATFKSCSIQVKEQLKVDRSETEPTTRKKLGLSELLSQCRHYNTTVKYNALTGVKELLSGHPELTHRNLASVLEVSSELFMDKDAVVRQTNHKVLKMIFAQVSSSQIAPFFPVLSAHLCCAMTHINDDVQQDSLLILDLCLEKCPEQITASSNKIMPNFIEQISRQTQTSNSKTEGRSLLVNPNSKLSSQKWRNRVMERIQKFLKALLAQKLKTASTSSGQQLVSGDARSTSLVHYFSMSRPNEVQPFGMSSPCSQDWFRLKHCLESGEEDSKLDLKKFVDILLPLLLQCWIEAGPSQLAAALPGNSLGAEAMNTLWNVVNLLELLLQLLDQTANTKFSPTAGWFCEKYMKELVQHLLPHFPYALHDKPLHSKGARLKTSKLPDHQISVLTLNLSVCKVFSYLMKYSGVGDSGGSWKDKVMLYLFEGLPGSRLSEEQLLLVVDIARKLHHSTQDTDTNNSLLSLMFDIFKKCHNIVGKETRALLEFFGDLAFAGSTTAVNSNAVLQQWMASLPSLMWLFIETSSESLDTDVAKLLLHYLKSAAPLQENNFVTHLKTLLFEHIFADNGVCLLKLPMEIQRKLISLVYWIPVNQLGRSEFQQLADSSTNVQVSQTVIQHLLDLLILKYQSSETVHDSTLSELLSFYLSLVIGGGSDTHGGVDAVRPGRWRCQVLAGTEEEPASLHRIFLIQVVSKSLIQILEDSLLLAAISAFVHKYLTDVETTGVHLLKAMGLLHIIGKIHEKLQCSVLDLSLEESTSVIASLFGAVVECLVSMEKTPDSCYRGVGARGVCMDVQTNVESIETDSPHQQVKSDHQIALSPVLFKAMWDMVVMTVMHIPKCFACYVSNLNDIECMDVSILQSHISALTMLMKNRQLQTVVLQEKNILQRIVDTREKSASDKKLKWWQQFKYEVSLL